MNHTDQFSDADIEQGIANMKAIITMLIMIRDGLSRRDPMRNKITDVVAFLKAQAEGSRALLDKPRVEIVES